MARSAFYTPRHLGVIYENSADEDATIAVLKRMPLSVPLVDPEISVDFETSSATLSTSDDAHSFTFPTGRRAFLAVDGDLVSLSVADLDAWYREV
jgi:hypothetical protein